MPFWNFWCPSVTSFLSHFLIILPVGLVAVNLLSVDAQEVTVIMHLSRVAYKAFFLGGGEANCPIIKFSGKFEAFRSSHCNLF